MKPSVKAITRSRIELDQVVGAGTEVLIPAEALSSNTAGTPVPFTLPGGPSIVRWADRSMFLELTRYLFGRNRTNFWALIHLRRMLDGQADFFLQEPETGGFGRTPFPFESKGELVYFSRSKNLQPADFLAVQASRLDRILQT